MKNKINPKNKITHWLVRDPFRYILLMEDGSYTSLVHFDTANSFDHISKKLNLISSRGILNKVQSGRKNEFYFTEKGKALKKEFKFISDTLKDI